MEEKYYLTKKGLERIRREYRKLRELKERSGRENTPRFLQSGDVNPEYLAFQEEMSLTESRLAEYQRVLKDAELITPPAAAKRGVIQLGATVTLAEEPGGEINEYTILGTLEANPAEGKISSESPVGRELMGKQVGDVVVIRSPIRVSYRVQKITYSLV